MEREEEGGCFGCSLLILAILVIGLFSWARQAPITPYPNLNGLLISAALLLIGGLALLWAYRFRRWLVRPLALILGLIVCVLVVWWLIWPAVRAIFDWLFAKG
jgi:uncharacterized protein YybS (DUF2232 family)